jgi:cob(I)alamin adenosyltransferase
MVNLTRIYTRTGDDGTTALGNFTRTAKTDPRLAAYADVDETNAAIGVAVTVGQLDAELVTLLRRVQNDLFDVGADLCTPLAPSYDHEPLRVLAPWVEAYGTGTDGGVNPLTAKYLNRLSDLLFILGRHANEHGDADVLWQPGGGR